jgi:outer membrane protein assembly factor BamC
LTKLAYDPRYRPQGGTVSASGVGERAVSTAAAGPAVALNSAEGFRIDRQGNQRWLVAARTPEQLWPQLQSFWQENGFSLVVNDAAAGVMETGWAENRAKLPQDILRRALGRLIDNAYDTGVRDSFRTRLERTSAGTEIFILHRSVTEEFAGQQRDRTLWRAGPNDPQLEAEFLSRLMVKLANINDGAARTTVASAPDRAAAPARASAPAGAATATSLEISDGFERAYRRVGVALDRTGFTVEDRDRSAGLYFVRYVAGASPAGEEPGFFSRLFASKDAQAPVRYRVLVKSAGEGKSLVTVQNSQGQPETGDVAKRIIELVGGDLR